METDQPWSAAASPMSSWHAAHGENQGLPMGDQELPVGKHCISPMGCSLCTNGYRLAAPAITHRLLLVTPGLLQLQKLPMGDQFQ